MIVTVRIFIATANFIMYDEQQFLEQEREVWKEKGWSEGLSQGLS